MKKPNREQVGQMPEEKQQALETMKMLYNLSMRRYLKEGDKVKIDVDRIKRRTTWDKMRSDLKEFVLSNENTVFTVEFDDFHNKYPSLVCFKEDTKDPKALWSELDLIRV